MRVALLSACAVLVASAVAAGPVQAHFGSSAVIVVPADHVNPGIPFEVVGVDLAPESTIEFTLVKDETVVPLGVFVSGFDGHFQTELQLPADYPNGYAQLFATAADGTQTSTWVLVGGRTDATPAPPGALWGTDPSVVILGMFILGGLAAIVYVLLKQRSRDPVTARATVPRRAASKRSTTRGRR